VHEHVRSVLAPLQHPSSRLNQRALPAVLVEALGAPRQERLAQRSKALAGPVSPHRTGPRVVVGAFSETRVTAPVLKEYRTGAVALQPAFL
jgi:hypothetical protein